MSATRRTVALVAAAATAVSIGAAASASAAPAVVHKTPHLYFAVNKAGIKLHGPSSFRAGRVAIKLKAYGNERDIQLVSFKKGYSYADFRNDLKILAAGGEQPTKRGLRHLVHAANHATLYGGFDVEKGSSARGTVVLPKAGTYYAYTGSNLPKLHPVKLHVSGPAVHRATPNSGGTIRALNGERFGGDSVLPHKGIITFKNAATDTPHFLTLQHVKKGTTKKDIENFFAGTTQGPPPFLAEGVNTDVLSEGLAQTINVDLPKGTYAEMCFFPDFMTGMPHAFMGMIKIVTLK